MANQAPPGASPHAEKCTQLESLTRLLEAAALESSTYVEIYRAATTANIMLAATVTQKSQKIMQSDLDNDAALTAARNVLSTLAAYAQGQLDSLRSLPPAPLPFQDSLSEINLQKEVSRLYSQATQISLPKSAKPHDLVRKIDRLYEHATSFVKQYPSDKVNKEVTPYKLLAAAASASSSSQIAQWWNGPGKTIEWAEHLLAAKRRLLTHIEETVQQVSERFTEAANSFDWLKEYRNDDDVAVLPSVMYAARLSSILADVPGELGTGSWPFAVAAKAALPHWLDVRFDSRKEEDPLEILAAIRRLPKDAFRKRNEALAEMRTEMSALVAANRPAAAASGGALPNLAQAFRSTGSTAAYAPLPSERPAAQQGNIMPRYWEKLSNDERRSFLLAQVNLISFADLPTSRDSYNKAVASFVQTHGTSPPLSAKFPLTPGTASVPSTACDKCSLVGHLSYACKSTSPVPAAKRNYRRQWRMVESEKRAKSRERDPPNWFTKPDRQVNLLGEVDELMWYEEDLFYPSQDDIDASLVEAGKA